MHSTESIGRRVAAILISVTASLAIAGCSGARQPAVGVIVESCDRGEAAEVAGLMPGDVITAWRQGEDMGEVPSPFHLRIVEQERAPLGPVELTVRRGSKSHRVVIPTGRWRVDLFPLLDRNDLARARDAIDAEEKGDFDTAAELWRSLPQDTTSAGQDLVAAFFYSRIGVALARAGQVDESAAIIETGTENVPEGRVRAAYWEYAGDSLLATGRMRDAADAFTRATGVLEDLSPNSPGMAFVQLQLCRTNFRACESEADRALEIYRDLGNGTIEHATALSCAATGDYFRADLEAADQAYQKALRIVRKVAAGSPCEGELLGNLGLVAMRRGDYATARERYLLDMAIADRLGPGTSRYSYAANFLGLLAKKTGRYELARLHYERALSSFRMVNPNGPEVAGVLTNLGNVALREKDYTSARHSHQEALSLRRQLDPTGADVAASLQNLGMASRQLGDLDSAQSVFEQALEIKLEIGPETGWLANTIFELGEVAREKGRLDEAETHHRRALEIRRRVSPQGSNIAESLFALGGIEQSRGHLADAEALWRESITMIEHRRRRLELSNNAGSRFGAIYESQYGSLARLLVATGRVDEAWNTLEMARATDLRSLVAQRNAPPFMVPSELWFARTRAEARMTRIESRLARIDPTADPEALQRYRGQLASMEAELDELDVEIRRAAPRQAELEAPRAMDLARLRRSLDPGTLVLAFTIGYSTSMVMATGLGGRDETDVRAFAIPVGRRELRSRVDRFNSLIARGRTIDTVEPAVLSQGRKLFDLLIGPAAEAVAGAERLLIIPDGPLHELSFAALVLPGEPARFLGHTTPIFVNPSASLAVELGAGSGQRSPGVGTVVAFGDPEYPSDSPFVEEHELAPLPGSRAEMETIRRVFGSRATLFSGPRASEANLKAHAGGADILHCAVHARVDPRVAMDSALFLSPPAGTVLSSDDGTLTAWEIVDSLDLDSALVVLSACSTARGRVIQGEGIIGLARAFQVAGARTVVVSQWAVPDSSTAELMTAFYVQLAAGRRTVEALQRAQQSVGNDPRLAHPYHWASFQVRGDWR